MLNKLIIIIIIIIIIVVVVVVIIIIIVIWMFGRSIYDLYMLFLEVAKFVLVKTVCDHKAANTTEDIKKNTITVLLAATV